MMHGGGNQTLSSEEADEQSRATGCGVGGAKGGARGEYEPAKHAPGTEPGKRVSAGTHTARCIATDGIRPHPMLGGLALTT
jgi:hypothetical protein